MTRGTKNIARNKMQFPAPIADIVQRQNRQNRIHALAFGRHYRGLALPNWGLGKGYW